jgi:PPOX class probable F420-dependent enzyme
MELAEDEARTRFLTVPVVRLATADDLGQPHIVVTTFVVTNDVIFTAVDSKPKQSRNLKRLRNVKINPRVSVLADRYEDDWTQLWWARADGTATVIEDEDGMAEPIRLLGDRGDGGALDRLDILALRIGRWSKSRPAGSIRPSSGWAVAIPCSRPRDAPVMSANYPLRRRRRPVGHLSGITGM